MKARMFFALTSFAVMIAAWIFLSPLIIDTVVDEDFPTLAPSQQPVIVRQGDTIAVVEMENDAQVTEDTTTIIMTDDEPELTEEEMADPRSIASLSGSFVDADSFHKGSGQALVIGDVLRFEDFSVTNGPDLRVYLATDDRASDFIDLGKLKGNQGNQNYDIPPGTDLEKYDTVLIWCRAFSVLFSPAELV